MRFEKIACIFGVLLAALVFISDVFFQKEYDTAYETYHVKSNDTLMVISSKYMPKQDRYNDWREFSFSIRQANQMPDSMIYAGQTLRIPLSKAKK